MTIHFYAHGSRRGAADISEGAPALDIEASTENCSDFQGPSGGQRHYLKDRPAARLPQTLGWLKTTYPNAIEFTAMTRELRGLAFMYGVAFGVMIAVGIGGCGIYAVFIGSFQSWQEAMILCGGVLIAVTGIAVGLYLFALLIRTDLFRPSDLPIIFDRKHRKVYRLLQDEQPGLRGMFKRWPVLACEYDWDLVDAEHHCTTYASAASIHSNHHLVFLVRNSHDDPTVIDTFQVANAHALGDDLVDSMWEHIRRFMEEDGPHLPDPSEPLASRHRPRSWWESMGVVGPYGPKFLAHWSNAPFLTSVILVLWPVTLPIHLLWGTGNYLSFRTEVAVAWPAVVRQRIGEPVRAPNPGHIGF